MLRDVIASGAVPTVRLTEIFRQAAESLIVTNAHRIHDGELPELGAPPAGGRRRRPRDFFFLEEDDPARRPRRWCASWWRRACRAATASSPHDIQVLAPMHRGELGAGEPQPAAAGGAHRRRAEELARGAPHLPRRRQGDAAPQQLRQGGLERRHRRMVRAESERRRRRRACVECASTTARSTYGTDELDELALAYAASVHKSQGTEYPAVVVPVHTQHFVMLQRNLLYTAVTRGKRLVVLVGSRKALGMAVRNADMPLRCSGLAHRLAAG